MTERSILCWSKCCKQPAKDQDDGEWIEPVRSKRSGRNTSRIKSGGLHANGAQAMKHKGATAVRWGEMGGYNSEIEKPSSIRWKDERRDSLLDASISDYEFDDLVLEELRGSYRTDSLMSDLSDDANVGKRSPAGHDSLGSLDEEENEDDIISSLDVPAMMTPGGVRERRNRGVIKPEALASAMRERSAESRENRNTMGLGRRQRKESELKEKSSNQKSLTKRMTSLSRGASKEAKKSLRKRMTAMNFKRLTTHSTISTISVSSDPVPKFKITSIAVLSDGFHFLTASRDEKVIRMYKQVPFDGDVSSKVELVKEFKGHKSGVTAIVTLDKKGRFLTAGLDKSIMLWDSRFDCEDDEEEEDGNVPEPITLLAKFDDPERWVHSIEVLNEGSYVRPTDDIDAAMVTAMARKTALEGAAAVQRAAIQREIIECSGTFATASKNDKTVTVWGMAVSEKREEDCSDANVADIKVIGVLEHNGGAINAIAATENMILAGDVTGNIYLWRNKRNSLSVYKQWTKLCKYSSLSRKTVATPEESLRQSITCLSFLEGKKGKTGGPIKFVSGSKSGTVRVWDISTASKVYHEVRKKNAVSVKIASASLSGIQHLPSIKDPNTKELCLAFSVASTDGRVISMSMYPTGDELVMFHVYDQSGDADDSNKDDGIHSIAVSQANCDGIICSPVVITGDGNNVIHLLKPKWSSEGLC